MGKKKQQKNTTSFKNDPFKTVKGFSALKQELKEQHPEVPQPEKSPPPQPEEREVDFSRAMKQLGVEEIDGDRKTDFAEVEEESETGATVPRTAAGLPEGSDEALFMASLGQMDTVFKDGLSDDDSQPKGPEPRRMKQLRQGRLRPQDTLDLHGCYRDEAREKVRHFLQHRYADGFHTLLIVTGKGKRSPNGESVLRSDIEKYLRTGATAWVAEWGRAPRQYGGEGALVVFLRTRK